MLSLHLQNLSFAYSDRVPLFADATLHLTAGWTGLVGANGSGKSTLLRLVKGELEPTRGHLQAQPPAARIELCTQRVEGASGEVLALAEAWDSAAQRLKGRLGLAADDLERWPTLSPGERKRWQVGAALWSEPHVLLLDEPTNHLDSAARTLLRQTLAAFDGIGLLVSHDRQLLDELTSATLRLDRATLRLWPGAYSAAQALWTSEEASHRAAHEEGRRQERKIRRQLADKRRQQRSAEAKISPRSRMKGRRDSDARTMAAKNRVRSAEQRLGRQVAVLRHRLASRETANAEFRFDKARGRSLFVDFEPAPAKRLITFAADAVRAGGRTLLRDVQLVVDRDTRTWLAGDNGAGKTTLLEALRRAATVAEDRLLYLPQELGRGQAAAILAQLGSLDTSERGRILELAAALGCDPEHLLATDDPSPGEARKLAIAFGLGRRVWALLLDEPTNHLDLPSIERLQSMLSGYPGALVLITHDARLAATSTDETWRIADGEVIRK